ncbi:MAG: membrane integrity-associated transporter subunit PqiC [Proteobacteria bacterium]|nr:membrane integrity-associated transporter subunit PqiC [Pseudomonadota bacterium]MBU1685802.1 membrane integrity-associated transporter subunit PqiC [Pseudomonadota bacterium]
MNKKFILHRCRIVTVCLSLLVVGGCNILLPSTTPYPSFYSLDSVPEIAKAAASATAPTLIINPPVAAAGFDNPRIIYMRETHKFEYFAHSEWVDSPARMLMPLLVTTIENSGAFRAVVLTPSSAIGDLRLDNEIIRLQHEFLTQPSQVHFTLRSYLVDNKTRRVLAWREFDTIVPAASDDTYGGVVAANHAVKIVLEELSTFCAEAVFNIWDQVERPEDE